MCGCRGLGGRGVKSSRVRVSPCLYVYASMLNQLTSTSTHLRCMQAFLTLCMTLTAEPPADEAEALREWAGKTVGK